jgi:hypothetical protein
VGAGVYKWADGQFSGDVYDGEYKDDKKHGRGTRRGRVEVQCVWNCGEGVETGPMRAWLLRCLGVGGLTPSLLLSRAVEPGPGCECGPLRWRRPGEWAAAPRALCLLACSRNIPTADRKQRGEG